jgi:hypothetical protein
MIKPTSDRKTRRYPSQKNTFGLLPGRDGTCPGATLGAGGCCDIPVGRKLPVCYVFRNMSAYPGVRAVLAHNTALLRQATSEEQVKLLVAEFTRFQDAELKHATRNKTPPWLYYRLHWSGDFFDQQYAESMVQAIQQFPDTRFWTYTRSLWAVPILTRARNLSTYISLDAVNLKAGLDCYYTWMRADRLAKHHNIEVCYMGKDNDTGLLLSECPVDSGKLALENGCANCTKCIGRPHETITGCPALKPILFKL